VDVESTDCALPEVDAIASIAAPIRTPRRDESTFTIASSLFTVSFLSAADGSENVEYNVPPERKTIIPPGHYRQHSVPGGKAFRSPEISRESDLLRCDLLLF
jgi:hypothetical protein